jgi:anaerobic magnesium-protoporphyrin IX monomethyl ester cyclase
MGLRVLFVYPLLPPGPEIYAGYHHGIGYLSAILRGRGHSTSLYATATCDPERIHGLLRQRDPQVVAITSTSADFPLARELAREILQCRQVPVYFGGPHATFAPEEILAVEGVRGLCRGEGEFGFARLVDSLERGERDTAVPGFWFRECGQVVRNPPGRPVLLAGLPFPDREVFGYAEWVRPFEKIMGAEFLGSRGCPFRCSYCSTPLYADLYRPEAYWRRRPVGDLLTEVKEVLVRYPASTVGFHDDIFTLDNGWLSEFCERYPEEVGVPFWCNTRVGCVTGEQAAALRRAGCFRVHVAVETGSPKLRSDVLNRGIADEEIIETFALLKRAGIKRLAFNMLGLPHETEETIRQTIALNRRIRPDRVHVTLFQPYPGSPLYDRCREEGLLQPGPAGDYYRDATRLRNPDLPPEILRRYLRDFVSLVYAS